MNKKQIIVGLIIGSIIVYLLSNVIVQKQMQNLQTMFDSKIETQTLLVEDLAQIIGRGGVNEKIATVVPECPSDEANQYDNLLSSLDKGLTKNELLGLNILFKRCGSIPASRRAGMSLLFEREVFFLNELLDARSLLGDYKVEETKSADWQLLSNKEKEISKLFLALVDTQRQIINTLATGGINSVTIESIQQEAQKIREQMTDVTQSAHQLRTALMSS